MNNKKDDSGQKSPFSEEALKQIAKEKILWALGVKIHFAAFIGVNIMLFVIDYLTKAPDAKYWFVYPLVGWFVGFFTHFTVYMIYSRGVVGGKKKGFILHAVVSVLAFLATFAINYYSDSSYLWFLWVLFGLIISVIVHGVLYRSATRPENTESKKTWMEQKIEKELEKVRKKRGGN
ncbi:MAG: 2TM domain-containing protein [Promethearchaeota archaeon]